MQFKKLNEVACSETLDTILGVKDNEIVQMESTAFKPNTEDISVVKEDYYYEVLMKDATFEYQNTASGGAKGLVNGNSLFTVNQLYANGNTGYYLVIIDNGVNKYEADCLTGPDSIFSNDNNVWVSIMSETSWDVTIPASIYEERNGDVKVTILYRLQEEKILVKQDGTPLTRPLVLDETVDYTVLPFKGDEALQAIIDGRQVLIKVQNAKGSDNTANYMPVLQYQLPNVDNNYLYLIYLKDGIATNIMTALATQNFDGVYGQLKMELSKTYTDTPLK